MKSHFKMKLMEMDGNCGILHVKKKFSTAENLASHWWFANVGNPAVGMGCKIAIDDRVLGP